MGIFLYFFFFMKLLYSFLLLAIVSAPVFSAISPETTTLYGGTPDVTADPAWLVADTTLADSATAYGQATSGITNAVDVILGLAGYENAAAMLTALETHVDDLYTCLAVEVGGAVGTCTRDGAGTGTGAEDNLCTADGVESALGDAGVLLLNQWLSAEKIVTGELPVFDTATLAAISSGSWIDEDAPATCFVDDLITDCEDDYTMLRALWDSSDVTVEELAAGGLTVAKIPDALYEFELLSQADAFSAIAAEFEHGVTADNEDAAWDDDLQTALNGLFCGADGSLNTATETADALADFTDVVGDFYEEDFDAFITAGGWDLSVAADDLDSDGEAAFLWLDSICIGTTIEDWIALFAALDGTFDLAPTCTEGVLVTLVEGDDGYSATDPVANTACPVCRADDADALVEGDDDFLYDALRSSEAGSLHFCIEEATDGGDGDGGDGGDGEGEGDSMVGVDMDVACADLEGDLLDACEKAWETANPNASARGFVLGFSLLATLALLWK